jgi:uncharacterized membrane protein
MENSTIDILLTGIAVGGFGWTFLRMLFTVLPLQIKEARVQNGLAKLRRQLLISGTAIMLVSLLGFFALIESVLTPRFDLMLEILIVLIVICLVIVAETKYRIYHEQYTSQHKDLARKIQHQMDQESIERKSV